MGLEERAKPEGNPRLTDAQVIDLLLVLSRLASKYFRQHEDQEDLVSTVLASLWEKGIPRGTRSPVAYAIAALRRRAASIHRRRARRAKLLDHLGETNFVEQAPAPEDVLSERETNGLQRRELRRRMEGLPDRQFLVVMLRTEGVPDCEIMRLLGARRVNTIHVLHTRALQKLREGRPER